MTDPGRLGRKIVGVLFAVGLAAGALVEVSGVLSADDHPTESFSWAAFWTGDNARVLESHLQEESPIAARVRPFYNELLFRFSGAPNRRLVIADDMLLERTRVEPHTHDYWQKKRETLVASITPLVRRLDTWGGKLLFAITPDAIRVYPEKLRVLEGSPKKPAYKRLLRALERAGAYTVDLEEALVRHRAQVGDREPLFRRDDHHWTHRGSLVGARAVARRIRELWAPKPRKLGLTKRYSETRQLGSFLRIADWKRGSAPFERFEDPANQYEVYDRSGARYMAPLDVGRVMIADSFGGFDTSSLVALHLDVPVAGMTAAAKGACYPAWELLQVLNEGYRPELVIWLFEEYASYRDADPWQGLLFGEIFPDARAGLHETPIPLDRVRADAASKPRRDGDVLQMTNVLQTMDVRLPRAVVRAPHLVFYIRPAKEKILRSFVSLNDVSIPADARAAPGNPRVMVLDSFEGRWQRVVLPVPAGSGDLVVTVRRPFLGREVSFRDFAGLSAEVPADSERLAGWKPRTFGVGAPTIWGRFEPPKGNDPLVPFPLASGPAPFCATPTSGRLVLDPPLPGDGRLDVVLGVEATACPKAGSVGFTFKLVTPDRERFVATRDVVVPAGASLRVPMTIDLRAVPTGARLAVEVRLSVALQGTVGAGVAFPK